MNRFFFIMYIYSMRDRTFNKVYVSQENTGFYQGVYKSLQMDKIK